MVMNSGSPVSFLSWWLRVVPLRDTGTTGFNMGMVPSTPAEELLVWRGDILAFAGVGLRILYRCLTAVGYTEEKLPQGPCAGMSGIILHQTLP